MTRNEAAKISLPEVNQKYKGWQDENKQRWEIARWIVWQEYNLNPYIKPGNKPKSPMEVLRFEGERPPIDEIKPEECHLSDEVILALESLYNDFKERQRYTT